MATRDLQDKTVELLRPSEITQMMGISRTTLHRWVKSGRLQCVLLPTAGSRQFRRFRLADVLQLLEARPASD